MHLQRSPATSKSVFKLPAGGGVDPYSFCADPDPDLDPNPDPYWGKYGTSADPHQCQILVADMDSGTVTITGYY